LPPKEIRDLKTQGGRKAIPVYEGCHTEWGKGERASGSSPAFYSSETGRVALGRTYRREKKTRKLEPRRIKNKDALKKGEGGITLGRASLKGEKI